LAYTINTCEIRVINMADQYGYGRTKEELVARKLRGYGAKVDLMPGSRGAYDLEVHEIGETGFFDIERIGETQADCNEAWVNCCYCACRPKVG